MNIDTYDVTPLYDEVINVAKAPRFTGRIFRDNVGEGYDWYELTPDEFVLGVSPWEAAEWKAKASNPGYGHATLAHLEETYPGGEIVPTP